MDVNSNSTVFNYNNIHEKKKPGFRFLNVRAAVLRSTRLWIIKVEPLTVRKAVVILCSCSPYSMHSDQERSRYLVQLRGEQSELR